MMPPILDPGRLAPRKPKVTEKHITDAVKGLLEIDGWRCFHMEPLSHIIQKRYAGELGMPDLLCLRYGWTKPLAEGDLLANVLGEILWIEVKRPGAKPKAHQASWHEHEKSLGAEVRVVDSYDDFREWYAGSGLNRRIRV